jgi:hypothetical protein
MRHTLDSTAPPLPINQCNPTFNTEFDENYAAPGTLKGGIFGL